MLKSEQITLAIAKIKSARPKLESYLDMHLSSRSSTPFFESCYNDYYEAAFNEWFDNYKTMVTHLEVALSVALADEFLTNPF